MPSLRRLLGASYAECPALFLFSFALAPTWYLIASPPHLMQLFSSSLIAHRSSLKRKPTQGTWEAQRVDDRRPNRWLLESFRWVHRRGRTTPNKHPPTHPSRWRREDEREWEERETLHGEVRIKVIADKDAIVDPLLFGTGKNVYSRVSLMSLLFIARGIGKTLF